MELKAPIRFDLIKFIASLILLSASLISVTYADYNDGYKAYDVKNYATALKEWRPLAEQGDVDAQAMLGFMYVSAYGVKQDYTKAIYWYRKAANQGDSESQFNLGLMFMLYYGQGVEQDYTKAVYWYRKAAEQGRADAQNNLGLNYYNGHGVKQDYTKAIYWYRKAAEQGYSWSQNNLGHVYERGRGVKQDYTKAIYWFRKAAEQGFTKGQINLGIMYYHGKGVEKDNTKARKWFIEAAAQGESQAKKYLNLMYPKKPLDNVNKGTGFVVTKNGILVTAQHIIENCKKIEVDGLKASIIASDKKNDIALIKVNKVYQDIASIETSSLGLGADVMVFGYPLSDKLSSIDVSLTKGSVSSLSGAHGDISSFRYTAATQPGNSGGPIVDTLGQVVGVVHSVMKNDKGSSVNRQNLNFGVRSSLLIDLMNSKNIAVAKQWFSKKEVVGHYEKVTKYIKCFK